MNEVPLYRQRFDTTMIPTGLQRARTLRGRVTAGRDVSCNLQLMSQAGLTQSFMPFKSANRFK